MHKHYFVIIADMLYLHVL